MNLPPIPLELEPPPLGLARIASAANLAHLSPEMFEAGIESGAIPLEIIRIGKRFKFVRSADLATWLSGRKTS